MTQSSLLLYLTHWRYRLHTVAQVCIRWLLVDKIAKSGIMSTEITCRANWIGYHPLLCRSLHSVVDRCCKVDSGLMPSYRTIWFLDQRVTCAPLEPFSRYVFLV